MEWNMEDGHSGTPPPKKKALNNFKKSRPAKIGHRKQEIELKKIPTKQKNTKKKQTKKNFKKKILTSLKGETSDERESMHVLANKG